jgi:hypothetical protein
MSLYWFRVLYSTFHLYFAQKKTGLEVVFRILKTTTQCQDIRKTILHAIIFDVQYLMVLRTDSECVPRTIRQLDLQPRK